VRRRDRAIAQRLRVWKLLEAGLYPIPVDPASRKPLVPWGELDRLGYRPGVGEAIEGTLPNGRRSRWVPLVFEWWAERPDAGAAVLTGLSRLLVVDVDPRNGGHHSLARLVAERPLPGTRIVRTRGGGVHLYYRVDRLVKSKAGLLGPGLDVKSSRGLVVSPPTPGYSGVERRPIAQAPGWLVARCGPTSRRRRKSTAGTYPPDSLMVSAALEEALAAIAAAHPGACHDTTIRQATRMFALCDHDQVEQALLEACRRTCAPSEWRDRERAVRDARAFVRGGSR